MVDDKLTVGALIFPGFELLDLFGPLEMFGLLPGRFEIRMLAEDPGPVVSGQGPSALAVDGFADNRHYDMLLVPGGTGTRAGVNNAVLLEFLKRTAPRVRYLVSVCTGSALLAKAGLLDGCRATTNKHSFDWAASNGPQVNWVRRARWVVDGKRWTSSGVSAGIDMSLGLIAAIHGGDVAEQVAMDAEYLWNRDPESDPFADRSA